MIGGFDKFSNYEVPTVTLCNPSAKATIDDNGRVKLSNAIGILTDPKGTHLKLNFNAPHEVSFDYERHISENPIKQSFYDNIYNGIATDRYLFVETVGFYIITSITDSDEDGVDKKSVTAQSCEREHENFEGINIEEDTAYQLTTADKKGLLDLYVAGCPNWTIKYIDPVLLYKNGVDGEARVFTFDKIDAEDGYKFLWEDIQKGCECIVEPDILTRELSFYSRELYAQEHKTDILIAYFNLLKYRTIEEGDEDKWTALNVLGKDEDLRISMVNPTGMNTLYNFTYRYAWMSPELQEALDKWQEKIESVEDEYYEKVSEYAPQRDILWNKEQDIKVLETQLEQLNSTRDAIIATGNDLWQAKLTEINQQMSTGLEQSKTELCKQYNALVNGNVDYAKRPVITPEEMVAAGYTDFEGDLATTYDMDYGYGDANGNILYTIKVTPILENRTVWSQSQLDNYVYDTLFVLLNNGSSIQDVLSYDKSHNKIIIHYWYGDPARDSEGLTTLDKQLDDIKQLHFECLSITESTGYQESLDEVNKLIDITTRQISLMRAEYNTLKSQIKTTYEDPISDINSTCRLGLTATDIDGNTIFTEELLEELAPHIKATDYNDEYLGITENMTWVQKYEIAKQLYDRAKSQMVKLSSGKKTVKIDTASFLFNERFKRFSDQLVAGAIINAEITKDTIEEWHLTGIDIDFDERKTDFTLGNKYDRSDLKSLFEDTLGSHSKAASDLKYLKSLIEEQQKINRDMSTWLERSRTLTLDNILQSQNQEVIINDRGYWGRELKIGTDGKPETDALGNPIYLPEQLKILKDGLYITRTNWTPTENDSGLAVALGKIYLDENSDDYVYGLNADIIMGKLFLGNNLILTGKAAGINIYNNDDEVVFDADDSGNLHLRGTITANAGEIAGWLISPTHFSKFVNGRGTGIQNPSSGTWSFAAGFTNQNEWATAPFRVDHSGNLYAESGTIAGWNIDDHRIYNLSNGRGTGMQTPTHGTWSFAAGFTNQNEWATAPFRVDHSGNLYAESGTIGSWNIAKNYLGTFGAVADTVFFSSSGLSASGWGSGKSYCLYARGKFAVDTNGVLYAKDADISGTVKAGSGNIGKWNIINNFLRCDTNQGYVILADDYVTARNSYSDGTYELEDARWWQIVVSATYGSISTYESDINVKNSVSPFDERLDLFFDKLKPCQYKYNFGTSGRYHTGFIAQEVVEALEESQLTTQEFAGIVKLEKPNYTGAEWMLRRDEFVSLNTWQIQKLKSKVLELEKEIQSLKSL